MPNLKDIRSRINTTKNTQQITKAMKLVSAAKLRKAQHQIQNMRPYATKLLSIIADIAVSERVEHELLKPVENPKTMLLVILTSDRGLCGGFNNNLLRYSWDYYQEIKNDYEKIDFVFIGKRAASFYASRKVEGVDTIYNLAKDVSFPMAREISEKIIGQYESGDYDEVRMIYNEFKSAIQQDIISEQILPVDIEKQTFDRDPNTVSFSEDMIFEPAPGQIIEELLHHHFAMQVYRILCESVVFEHGARMSAMENATNNAKELIGKLTLTYNKLRQAAITTELTEIVSGAEALNG